MSEPSPYGRPLAIVWNCGFPVAERESLSEPVYTEFLNFWKVPRVTTQILFRTDLSDALIIVTGPVEEVLELFLSADCERLLNKAQLTFRTFSGHLYLALDDDASAESTRAFTDAARGLGLLDR